MIEVIDISDMDSTSGLPRTLSEDDSIIFLREFDQTSFPGWVEDFCKSCMEAVTTKCSKKLDKLMSSYLVYARREQDYSSRSPSRSHYIAKQMYKIITFFYLYYQDVKDFFVTTHWTENIIELLVIYCKLEIRSASRIVRGKENDTMVSNRIMNLLWICLESDEHNMLHVLLKMVKDKYFCRRQRDMFGPIFRKILVTKRPKECTDLEYIRNLLAFKTWKRLMYKNEKKEISDTATEKLIQPSDFRSNYRKYSFLPPLDNERNLHHFLLTTMYDVPHTVEKYFTYLEENKNKNSIIETGQYHKISFMTEFSNNMFEDEQDDLTDMTDMDSYLPLLESIKRETDAIYSKPDDDIIIIDDTPAPAPSPTPKSKKPPILLEFIDLTEEDDFGDVDPPSWVNKIIPLTTEYTEELIRKQVQEEVAHSDEEEEFILRTGELTIERPPDDALAEPEMNIVEEHIVALDCTSQNSENENTFQVCEVSGNDIPIPDPDLEHPEESCHSFFCAQPTQSRSKTIEENLLVSNSFKIVQDCKSTESDTFLIPIASTSKMAEKSCFFPFLKPASPTTMIEESIPSSHPSKTTSPSKLVDGIIVTSHSIENVEPALKMEKDTSSSKIAKERIPASNSIVPSSKIVEESIPAPLLVDSSSKVAEESTSLHSIVFSKMEAHIPTSLSINEDVISSVKTEESTPASSSAKTVASSLKTVEESEVDSNSIKIVEDKVDSDISSTKSVPSMVSSENIVQMDIPKSSCETNITYDRTNNNIIDVKSHEKCTIEEEEKNLTSKLKDVQMNDSSVVSTVKTDKINAEISTASSDVAKICVVKQPICENVSNKDVRKDAATFEDKHVIDTTIEQENFIEEMELEIGVSDSKIIESSYVGESDTANIQDPASVIESNTEDTVTVMECENISEMDSLENVVDGENTDISTGVITCHNETLDNAESEEIDSVASSILPDIGKSDESVLKGFESDTTSHSSGSTSTFRSTNSTTTQISEESKQTENSSTSIGTWDSHIAHTESVEVGTQNIETKCAEKESDWDSHSVSTCSEIVTEEEGILNDIQILETQEEIVNEDEILMRIEKEKICDKAEFVISYENIPSETNTDVSEERNIVTKPDLKNVVKKVEIIKASQPAKIQYTDKDDVLDEQKFVEDLFNSSEQLNVDVLNLKNKKEKSSSPTKLKDISSSKLKKDKQKVEGRTEELVKYKKESKSKIDDAHKSNKDARSKKDNVSISDDSSTSKSRKDKKTKYVEEHKLCEIISRSSKTDTSKEKKETITKTDKELELTVENVNKLSEHKKIEKEVPHLKTSIKLVGLMISKKDRKFHLLKNDEDSVDSESTALSDLTVVSELESHDMKMTKKEECIYKVYKRKATIEHCSDEEDPEIVKQATNTDGASSHVTKKNIHHSESVSKKSSRVEDDYVPEQIKRRSLSKEEFNELNQRISADIEKKRRNSLSISKEGLFDFSDDSELEDNYTEKLEKKRKSSLSKKEAQNYDSFSREESLSEDKSERKRRNSGSKHKAKDEYSSELHVEKDNKLERKRRNSGSKSKVKEESKVYSVKEEKLERKRKNSHSLYKDESEDILRKHLENTERKRKDSIKEFDHLVTISRDSSSSEDNYTEILEKSERKRRNSVSRKELHRSYQEEYAVEDNLVEKVLQSESKRLNSLSKKDHHIDEPFDESPTEEILKKKSDPKCRNSGAKAVHTFEEKPLYSLISEESDKESVDTNENISSKTYKKDVEINSKKLTLLPHSQDNVTGLKTSVIVAPQKHGDIEESSKKRRDRSKKVEPINKSSRRNKDVSEEKSINSVNITDVAHKRSRKKKEKVKNKVSEPENPDQHTEKHNEEALPSGIHKRMKTASGEKVREEIVFEVKKLRQLEEMMKAKEEARIHYKKSKHKSEKVPKPEVTEESAEKHRRHKHDTQEDQPTVFHKKSRQNFENLPEAVVTLMELDKDKPEVSVETHEVHKRSRRKSERVSRDASEETHHIREESEDKKSKHRPEISGDSSANEIANSHRKTKHRSEVPEEIPDVHTHRRTKQKTEHITNAEISEVNKKLRNKHEKDNEEIDKVLHLSKRERRERKKQTSTSPTETFKAVSLGNNVCKVRIVKENLEDNHLKCSKKGPVLEKETHDDIGSDILYDTNIDEDFYGSEVSNSEMSSVSRRDVCKTPLDIIDDGTTLDDCLEDDMEQTDMSDVNSLAYSDVHTVSHSAIRSQDDSGVSPHSDGFESIDGVSDLGAHCDDSIKVTEIEETIMYSSKNNEHNGSSDIVKSVRGYTLNIPETIVPAVSNSVFEQFVTEQTIPLDRTVANILKNSAIVNPPQQEHHIEKNYRDNIHNNRAGKDIMQVQYQESHLEVSVEDVSPAIKSNMAYEFSDYLSKHNENQGNDADTDSTSYERKRRNEISTLQTYNSSKPAKIPRIEEEYEEEPQRYNINKRIGRRPPINRVYSKNKSRIGRWEKYLMKQFKFDAEDLRKIDTKIVVNKVDNLPMEIMQTADRRKPPVKKPPEPTLKLVPTSKLIAPSKFPTVQKPAPPPIPVTVPAPVPETKSNEVVSEDLLKLMMLSGSSTILERQDYTKSKNQDSQTLRARVERRPTSNTRVKFAIDSPSSTSSKSSASSYRGKKRGSTISPEMDILFSNLDSLSLNGCVEVDSPRMNDDLVNDCTDTSLLVTCTSDPSTGYQQEKIANIPMSGSPDLPEHSNVYYNSNIETDNSKVMPNTYPTNLSIRIPTTQILSIPLPAEIPYWDNINSSTSINTLMSVQEVQVVSNRQPESNTRDVENIYRSNCYESPCPSPDHETHLPIKKRRVSSLKTIAKDEAKPDLPVAEVKDISYPSTPMISIAELENLKSGLKFKTAAERKELPPLIQESMSLLYESPPQVPPPPLQHYMTGPLDAVVQVEQPLSINHTYNNPTINYHIGSSPLVNLCYPPASQPYSSLLNPLLMTKDTNHWSQTYYGTASQPSNKEAKKRGPRTTRNKEAPTPKRTRRSRIN